MRHRQGVALRQGIGVTVVGCLLAAGAMVSAPSAAAAPAVIRVNFQPASAPVPTGYVVDSGKPFNGTSGWEDFAGVPTDYSANTRDRNRSISPDQRYDTLIAPQYGIGATKPGAWRYALPSGEYDVTVGVGDADAIDSVNQVVAEPGTPNEAVVVDQQRPASAARFATATARVTVTDGFLTLSPSGGTNTKLDFVDIAKVETTPPPNPTPAPNSTFVNFQPAGAPVPAGYLPDTGAPFNGTSGWQDYAGNPLNLSTSTRDRNSSTSPDQRYDTLIAPQYGVGATTPGRWQFAVPNGQYDLTVGVGDAGAIDSVNQVVAEPGGADESVVVDHFRPTSTARFSTGLARVSVNDGFLTLSNVGSNNVGGSNTKLDFVIISPVPSGAPTLALSGPHDEELGLATPRLVFSSIRQAVTPAQSFTFSNTGAQALTVSNLAIAGTDASAFTFAAGQATSLTIPAGASATVDVLFTPGPNSFCATSSDQISTSERFGVVTFTTNDPTRATGSADLAGLNTCAGEAANEPVLDQITSVLGYSDVTSNGTGYRRRALGPLRPLPNSDEVQSPYFVAADPSRPVTMTPVAHYGARTTSAYGASGWFAQGAAITTPCNGNCKQLFYFQADQPAPGAYPANQMLFPAATGTTSFIPTGAFGVYNGDGPDVNYSDDAKNPMHTTTNADIVPAHYGHTVRVFPALGPGRVAIPNTWIVAFDLSRVPGYKNNDFQDVIYVLRNAAPQTPVAPAPGSPALVRSLTTGGTVTADCAVTGFDGVLRNAPFTQCNPGNIAFGAGGLSLTSTAGEMANGLNTQQNALYNLFDASKTSFTATARIAGPLPTLGQNYQQIGTFFGVDQDNYVKVEVEHNGTAGDPHVTMLFEENGVAVNLGSVSVPALATAKTVDLIIKGNSSAPDQVQPAADVNKVRGYPLDQLSVYYSINGATPVQVGTVARPADVMKWFSTSAKAGILVSGGGAAAPITATFSTFKITT